MIIYEYEKSKTMANECALYATAFFYIKDLSKNYNVIKVPDNFIEVEINPTSKAYKLNAPETVLKDYEERDTMKILNVRNENKQDRIYLNRGKFILKDITILLYGDFIAFSYAVRPETVASFSDSIHQLASFSRDCNASKNDNLRKDLCSLLERVIPADKLVETETIYLNNNSFIFKPYSKDEITNVEAKNTYFDTQIFQIYANDNIEIPKQKENETTLSIPAGLKEYAKRKDNQKNICYSYEYSVTKEETRLIPKEEYISNYIYAIAKSESLDFQELKPSKEIKGNIKTSLKNLEIFQAQSGLFTLNNYKDRGETAISLAFGTLQKIEILHDKELLRKKSQEIQSDDEGKRKAQNNEIVDLCHSIYAKGIDLQYSIHLKCLSKDRWEKIASEYLKSTSTEEILDNVSQYSSLCLSQAERRLKEIDAKTNYRIEKIMRVLTFFALASAVKDLSDLIYNILFGDGYHPIFYFIFFFGGLIFLYWCIKKILTSKKN